jgi:hypothetical protein
MDTRAEADYAACGRTEGATGETIVTEAEWLNCTNPQPMLEFLRGKASDRKLRLLAVACCRRVQHRLRNAASERALDLLEFFADGSASHRQLKAAVWEAQQTAVQADEQAVDNQSKDKGFRASAAAWAVVFALQDGFFGESDDVLSAAAEASLSLNELSRREKRKRSWPVDWEVAMRDAEQIWGREHRAQCALVREIFGPIAFRRVRIKNAWLRWDDETMPRITRTIYDHRAFDLMPKLADALEEAGCDNADILAHCRQPGPHVRGCWVVDLLLGKA